MNNNIFSYIYNLLFVNKSNDNRILKELFIIAFLVIIYYVYMNYVDDTSILYEQEGFTQTYPYIYLKNDKIYDDFYNEIYDIIYDNYERIPLEIEYIIKITQPSNESKILILPSTTGIMVNEFLKYKYKCVGLETSQSMINYSKKKYPDALIVNDNILDPMCFNKKLFTHIICNNFNFYKYKEKEIFFKHCHYWLKSNGYLIVHLIDSEQFNTIIPVANPTLCKNINNNVNEQIKKCNVNFLGFHYNMEYIFKDNNIMTLKEKFTDKKTNNIREQEQTFYMKNKEEVEKIAKQNGFHLHSKTNMKRINNDEYQYIYIFEKIH